MNYKARIYSRNEKRFVTVNYKLFLLIDFYIKI